MERRYLVDAFQTQKERQRLENRNQEIDGMFLSLYTDKAKGILTEQRFIKLTAALVNPHLSINEGWGIFFAVL